jgi:RimJ/RimL family protein N-acetyltransferase
MSFADSLAAAIAGSLRRRYPELAGLAVTAPDPWAVDARFTLPAGVFRLRSLATGDVPVFHAFGAVLSATGKHFFSPYPWDEVDKLDGAFQAAIDASVSRVDASYFLECDGAPIGHFFLWKAGGNPHARAHGVEVPELGIAVGDAWQGQGFGGLIMAVLRAVAEALHADAIELTTALENENGWQTYLRAGYAYTGIIRNPQFVDVTAVANGTAVATVWRDERQMVLLLNAAKRDAVLTYLAVKREEAGRMCGGG